MPESFVTVGFNHRFMVQEHQQERCILLAVIILFAERFTSAIPSCQKEAFADMVSNPESSLSSGMYL